MSLPGVHAFLSNNMFEHAAAEAEQLRHTHPDLAAQVEVVRPSDPSSHQQHDTLASLRIPTARGAVIQQKAASLWPYKLVASVLERLISAFPAPAFNLQTNTPVTSLSRSSSTAPADPSSSSSLWTLTTPRGTITARHVLLATNAYTSHLLPAFSDLIVPVRGQVAALKPTTCTTTGTQQAKLAHSYVFAADPDAGSAAPRDDYLVQRPLHSSEGDGEGEMIYGGGRRLARGLGVGEWRDDEVEGEVAAYLRGNLSPPLDLSLEEEEKEDGGEDDGGGEEMEASFEWTGVMGYSRDRHAWVGAVPESLGGGEGLWICAGYTGHGMPAAALSAREVVRLMMDGRGEEQEGVAAGEGRLPKEFVLSEERVAEARGLPHLMQGWEATILAALIGDGKEV